MGTFHFYGRPRGHGLHLGLFKVTRSTRQEAYDSRMIEMAKWGNFVPALEPRQRKHCGYPRVWWRGARGWY